MGEPRQSFRFPFPPFSVLSCSRSLTLCTRRKEERRERKEREGKGREGTQARIEKSSDILSNHSQVQLLRRPPRMSSIVAFTGPLYGTWTDFPSEDRYSATLPTCFFIAWEEDMP